VLAQAPPPKEYEMSKPKGTYSQVTGGTPKTIETAALVPFTHLVIGNRTGAILYILTDSTDTPSSSKAYLALDDKENITLEFDNAAQCPGTLRVASSSTGYVHLLSW